MAKDEKQQDREDERTRERVAKLITKYVDIELKIKRLLRSLLAGQSECHCQFSDAFPFEDEHLCLNCGGWVGELTRQERN